MSLIEEAAKSIFYTTSPTRDWGQLSAEEQEHWTYYATAALSVLDKTDDILAARYYLSQHNPEATAHAQVHATLALVKEQTRAAFAIEELHTSLLRGDILVRVDGA